MIRSGPAYVKRAALVAVILVAVVCAVDYYPQRGYLFGLITGLLTGFGGGAIAAAGLAAWGVGRAGLAAARTAAAPDAPGEPRPATGPVWAVKSRLWGAFFGYVGAFTAGLGYLVYLAMGSPWFP